MNNPNEFFTLSFLIGSDDFNTIVTVVNQGIDSRLEGFTKSSLVTSGKHIGKFPIYYLHCNFHSSELQILLRRLLELETESAEMLADDIVWVKYGVQGY